MSNDVNVTFDTDTVYSLCHWISGSVELAEPEMQKLANEDYFLSLVALANQCWLIAALTQGIKQKGSWGNLPEHYRQYLDEVCLVYKNRATDLINEIELVVPLLNQVGITPVLIKGGANLISGVSSPQYIRYMNDIDILVPEANLALATEQLVKHDFKLDDESYDIDGYQHHHQSPLKRESSLCFVELHRWHCKKSLLSLLPINEVWQSAEPILGKPFSVNVCKPTHQVIINIIHSELSDRGYFEKDIQLFQLFALYQLVSFYQDDIDWHFITNRFEQHGVQQVLYARLYQLTSLFGCQLPICDKKLACKGSQKQLVHCLSNLIERQGSLGLGTIILGQLSEYHRLSIKAHYGVDRWWDVQVARSNVMKNQLKKIFSWRYLKKFVWANFN